MFDSRKRFFSIACAVLVLTACAVLLAMPGVASAQQDFTQDEIDDPLIWYAVPDRVQTLARPANGNAYSALLSAITASPAHQITHIYVPMHMNTGNIFASAVAVRPGATVVVIGAHPRAPGGQVVLSDTDGGANPSRVFLLRGDGGAANLQSGLVLRNFVVQRGLVLSATATTPDVPPAPRPIPHTGTGVGGGIAIENAALAPWLPGGGGGHLILCQGAVIRNCSTGNSGAVDVQANGRLTLMPGSIMHDNYVGVSGGAIHLRNNARMVMHGGELRGNQADARGGAIDLQGAGARLEMHAGSITGNSADNGGALYVARSNLGNVRIASQVIFSDNEAREGIKIDSDAARNNPQINPGQVSLHWYEERPAGSGHFFATTPHALNNYDINAQAQVSFSLETPLTTLSLGHTSLGAFANLSQVFDYHLFLTRDEQGQLPLTGPVAFVISGTGLAEPIEQTAILCAHGSLKISLSHGQQVVFQDIPQTASFRAVAQQHNPYSHHHIDGALPDFDTTSADTGSRLMTPHRRIDFFATWRGAPPTKLWLPAPRLATAYLVIASLLLLATTVLARPKPEPQDECYNGGVRP
ncbi:MAG: hypothetical protein FWE46_03140 [Coriobacteriia bacterium]|nr:hypothetical protein [Coriobacteriia bacterium]MCL2537312.1 hypothetical protein [Coriobacteriia bacterium]